jgi:hypothetical protein
MNLRSFRRNCGRFYRHLRLLGSAPQPANRGFRAETADGYRFCPELFEVRADVLASLDNAGYKWSSHFSSVDLLHDLYGVEVCGILERTDAVAIQQLLRAKFPTWRTGCLCYKDYGREPGFKARIFRDLPRRPEEWETA